MGEVWFSIAAVFSRGCELDDQGNQYQSCTSQTSPMRDANANASSSSSVDEEVRELVRSTQ